MAFPRGLIIGLELVAVFAVLGAGTVTYGLYRLAQGPVDVQFAKDYIESALSSKGNEVRVRVGAAQLSWPGLTGPLRLDLKDLLVEENGQPMIEVRDLSLALAKAPLLIGRIRPERLILRAPLLTLERDRDDTLHFALGGSVTGVNTGSNENITRALMAMMFDNTTSDFGIFSRVEEVAIEQAQIRISDADAGMTWRLNDVDLSFRKVDVGVYGSIDVQLPNEQQFSLLLTYRRESDDLTISSQFRDFALTTFASRLFGIEMLRHQRLPLTGDFQVKGHLKNMQLDTLSLNATSTRGTFETRQMIGVDLPVTGARVKLKYDRATSGWSLPDFAFNLADVPVRATGKMQRQEDGEYNGNIILDVGHLDLKTVDKLWPDDLRDLPLAHWLTQKLSGATLSDIKVNVPIWAGRKERQLTLLAMRPTASFAFRDLKADYRPPLYPVEDAAGTGFYDNDTLTVKVDKGSIKGLKVKEGTTVVLDDLAKAGAGTAQIHLDMDGDLSTVLDYIALEPINLDGKIGIKSGNIKGQGEYKVDLAFPTVRDLKADQVDVDVTARLNDISLPGLVKGQALAGGPYDLKVVDGIINLKGTGTLAGQAVKLDFTQPVRAAGHDVLMQVEAHVNSNEELRQNFSVDLPFLQGNMPLDVVYTENANGLEKIDITADLTPTRILLESLRYEKAPGLKADMSMTLTTKNGALVDGKNLNISAPDLKIAQGSLRFGKIEGAPNLVQANFPNVTLGKSRLNVVYTREQSGMNIRLAGPRLDLSPYMDSKNDHETVPAVVLNAKVDALRLSGSEDLKNASLTVGLNNRADLERLELSGVTGKSAANIRYVPNAQGKMTLAINADDAGAFLRVMGIYDNMIGGKLSIDGSPIGNNNRDVKGNLLIKDFAIIKAPVLAQLLGSMSVQGLGEQLTNKGLVFSRLESGFAWLRRPNLDLMSFREGRTAGSALGLTFDGLYDRRKETIEVNGTIIPISGLNTFASNIPLLGQLLTGGKGNALFAATYSIKGSSDKPQTFVNPLSVLTPGILRRIFFENSPDDPLKVSATPRKTKRKTN